MWKRYILNLINDHSNDNFSGFTRLWNIYDNIAKKCDASMEKRDVDFRKTALILSWISVMLYSLVLILGIVFGLVDLKYKLYQLLSQHVIYNVKYYK